MSNNRPSIDPADNGSLAGTLRFVLKKFMQDVDGMLPAKVINYDRDTNRATVQILIQVVGTDGTIVSRPRIASVPVLVLGSGGFMVNFPINVGDYGWIYASDRDISIFLQSYEESQPNTERVKSFSDGMFIPDVMRDYTINAEDEDRMVISSVDGLTRVALGDGVIKATVSDSLGTTFSTFEMTPGVSDMIVSVLGVSSTIQMTSANIVMNTLLLYVYGDIHAGGAILPGQPPPP